MKSLQRKNEKLMAYKKFDLYVEKQFATVTEIYNVEWLSINQLYYWERKMNQNHILKRITSYIIKKAQRNMKVSEFYTSTIHIVSVFYELVNKKGRWINLNTS